MEGGALLTPEFQEFSKNHVMFLHVTTQIKGRKDDDLLGKKGGRGFPFLCVMDDQGNVLAQHEGDRTAEAFEATVGEAQKFIDLKKRAASGDKPAGIDYALARCRKGQINFEELSKELKPLGKLTAEQQKAFDGLKADDLVRQTLDVEVGRKFAEMQSKGIIPVDEEQEQRFWEHIRSYAETTKNVKVFETWLAFMKTKFGSHPNAKPYFEAQEQKLAEMKAAAGTTK